MEMTLRIRDKQLEAVNKAQQHYYLKEFGPWPVEWGSNPDKMLDRIIDQFTTAFLDQFNDLYPKYHRNTAPKIPQPVKEEYLAFINNKIVEIAAVEGKHGAKYLYYPSFSQQLTHLGEEEDWQQLRLILEERYGLHDFKAIKQLDDLEDYEYLLNLFQDSLQYAGPNCKRWSLQVGIDWANEQITILQMQRAEAREKALFYNRLEEVRHLISMSFSTPADDNQITVYDAVAENVTIAGTIWCPMQTGGLAHEHWLGYSPNTRGAIRLSFVHGLCRAVGFNLVNLDDWHSIRPEVESHLIKKLITPIKQHVAETRAYIAGRDQIEVFLNTIYGAGQHIPYHPNFDRAFFAQLEQVPIHGINDFLTGFCAEKGLDNFEGHEYLIDLVTDAVERAGIRRPTAIKRALAWLRMGSDNTRDTSFGNQQLSTPRLPIDDMLAIPRAILDQVLLKAVMIEPTAEPGRYRAKPSVRPWQWANVRAALQTKLLLSEVNDAGAAQLFSETYGAIVKPSTMKQRPQNEQNNRVKTRRALAYKDFFDRLPTLNFV